MANRYDAIVVGARCAGSPTAMLLARKGYNVLVVDRATFPSDTFDAHSHPPGVAALKQLGHPRSADRNRLSPIHTYSFDFGPFTISGPGDRRLADRVLPPRTVLDKLLVDAASEAGPRFAKSSPSRCHRRSGRVLGSGHGKAARRTEQPTSSWATARRSRAVAAERKREAALLWHYSYWSGLPSTAVRVYVRPTGVGADTTAYARVAVGRCEFEQTRTMSRATI